MDLFRSDTEVPDVPAKATARPFVSDANTLLAVLAAILVLGAGSAFLAFNLGKATGDGKRATVAAAPPTSIPALRDDAPGRVPSPAASTEPTVAAAEPPAGTQAVAADDADWRVFPRLKPSLRNEVAQSEPSASAGKALALGRLLYATEEDRSVAPFFMADAVADRIPPPPMPVVYARDLAEAPHAVDVALERGETFVDALRRAGVRAEDRNGATAAFGALHNLRALRPGQTLRMTVAPPNETLFQQLDAAEAPRLHLLALDFRPAPGERLELRRRPTGEFAVQKKVVPLVSRTVSVAGFINGSVYASAKRVGAPDEVIAQLSDVFAYDVDFQREIFAGDEFEALFEVKYDDTGAVVSASDVLYARLKFRGRTKEKAYYRFVTADGSAEYFDSRGESARRLLMKTPIDGARLSSGFGTRRHPILGYMKEHKGVDFAAPTGTPVKAAGDGVVERAGPFSTFGNYVKIRHGGGYQTAYAHLSRFSAGMKAGRRVRQGDIIAYVGTTGRSTGPHLHYEVHYKGSPVNPQNLKVATGVELSGADLGKFKAQRDRVDAMRTGMPAKRGLLAKDDGKASSL